MTTDFVSVAPQINRDRYGRPLILPRGGGKPVAYTRCTSYIDVLDDKFNLQQWQQRMVAIGLSERPDLLLGVGAHRDDKKALTKLCADAREAAGASSAATTGTALHALTEIVDRGEKLPPGLPAGARASLDAYAEATSHLKMLHVERFLVQDSLQVGGTADRIVKDAGTIKIFDTKTGSIEWGALKIAMQLAVYAHSNLYDIETGERSHHHASATEGIVAHLPATDDPAEARCDLYYVDLVAGWSAVKVATQVRQQRKLKFKDTMWPAGTEKPVKETKFNADAAPLAVPTLVDRINACGHPDDVRGMWAAHQGEWTDEHTEAARARIAQLEASA